MEQLLLMAPAVLAVPRPMSPVAGVAVNEVNERAWCVAGAVTAATLAAVPVRPSASTGISRENSLTM
jgi:hypothetical protein